MDKRRWGRLGLGLTLAAVGMSQTVARSAVPASGTIDTTHRTVTWKGGPLVGSAPATKRYFCASPTTCDDFTLTVNLPAAAFPGALPRLNLSISTTAPNQFDIVTYEPGSEPAVTNSDYGVYSGGAAHIVYPKAGLWHVKAACVACVDASYTMTATADSVPAPKVLANLFHAVALPGPDAKTIEAAGEPGIAIGRNGEIWVNGPGLAADFWGSYDGGRTFTLHQPDISPTSGDTWLTIGAGGEVYADNLSHAGGTNLLYVTKDGGKTWANMNTPIGSVPYLVGTDSDRQWITADPKVPGTIYFESHDLGDNGIVVSKSTNYGQTWTPLASITFQEVTGHSTTDSLGGNTTGPISFSPDGTTMVFSLQTDVLLDGLTALPTRTDFDLTKQYAVTSTDGGSAWKFNLIADRKGKAYVGHLLGGSIVFDRAGTMYFTWSERPYDATTTNVVFTRSVDGGKTWSAPAQVSDNGGSNVFTAIAAGGDPGRVNIAWLESQASDFNDPGATWRVVMSQSTDALSAVPTWTKSQVSPGIMHAADICQAGTLCAVTGGNRDLADYIWMENDKDGLAHIAYADDATGVLRTVVANQTSGTGTVAGVTQGPIPRITAPPLTVAGARAGRLPATGAAFPTAGFGVAACGVALAVWPRRRRQGRR